MTADLDRALRALAEETDEDAAPAVEERLRAAFRAQPASYPPEASPAPWIWLASLASAAGVVWLMLSGRPAPAPTPPATVAAAPAEPAAPAVAAPVAAVPAPARPVRTQRPARRAQPAPFEALYPGDPLADLDAVHVVRVSVPRSSLFALGLRPGPGAYDDAVEMDAMVGPDGVARAVRFVTSR